MMAQLKVKMHLINVENSPTNEEPLKKYASSGYKVIPIKGTCHYPMIENPDELNRLLEDVVLSINRQG